MLNETVRPQTFPNELALQLLLSNAIEIVFLIQADCTVEDTDREILRRTANRLTPTIDQTGSFRLSGVTPESLDVVVAATSALQADSLTALREQLDVLGEALTRLADDKRPLPDIPMLLEDLRKIRAALTTRRSGTPDEVRELLSGG